MGYSHYWRIDLSVVTPEQFAQLGADALRLFDVTRTSGIVLAREFDNADTPPSVGEGVIVFNGVGEDDGHETFYFDATSNVEPSGPRPSSESLDDEIDYAARRLTGAWMRYDRVVERGNVRWSYCKTAQKPYDVVVCALLMRAKLIFGDGIEIRSDGDFDTDWARARTLYLLAYGESAASPLEPDEE
jgi:hypothetical protein